MQFPPVNTMIEEHIANTADCGIIPAPFLQEGQAKEARLEDSIMARGTQKEKLGAALTQASAAQQTIKMLRERVDHQRQLIHGMWELLKMKLGCTDDDLRKAIATLQKVDQTSPRSAELCPKCGRPLQENTPICVYCGELHESRKLF